MRRHWAAPGLTSGLLLGLLATACVPTTARPPSTQSTNDLVLVETGDGLAALDWAAGRLRYTAPHALAAPDGTRLVAPAHAVAAHSLDVLDAQTGTIQTAVTAPATLTPSVISTDGRRVALAPLRTDTDTDTWQPAGRERTQLAIVALEGTTAPRVFDLAGNYEPDAFSADDRHLFVLEYQPPAAPDRYRVRQLDLATGTVSGVGSRTKVAVPEEEMRGTRRMHVLSPDRTTLYTLYTHQPDHLHARDLAVGLTVSPGNVDAFVHVLNLSQGWAYCLDLPQPFGVGPAAAHALAISPDGRWLYVADRSSGMLAVADTDALVLRTTRNVGADPRAEAGPTAAQVGPDGTLYVAGASAVLALDPRTLEVVRHLPVPAVPHGLGISADGRHLYLSLSDRVAALDAATGAELSSVALPGAAGIAHVATAGPR